MENLTNPTSVVIHAADMPDGTIIVSVDYNINDSGPSPLAIASQSEISRIVSVLAAADAAVRIVSNNNDSISDSLSNIGLSLSQ